MREVDLVVVKGKTKPVGVYEVLDYHTAESFPNMMDLLGHFSEGLSRYRAAQWDPAIKSFEKALSLNPADALSATYLERCKQMKGKPPGDQWDGVWIMSEK